MLTDLDSLPSSVGGGLLSVLARGCATAGLAFTLLVLPTRALAWESSYATMLRNTSTMQTNLNNQMFNLGSTIQSSGGGNGPPPCLPPFDLQRGMDGHVPPELQGDPRYQEYLRCSRGQPGAQATGQQAPRPAYAPAQHLPIAATDFVPVQSGHPIIGKAIREMPLSPEQRNQLRGGIEEMLKRIRAQYRANNFAVAVAIAYSSANVVLTGSQAAADPPKEMVLAINDKLAQEPGFQQMSPLDRQNNSDSLIFESAIIAILRELGKQDPAAQQQAVELSRAVMTTLGVS